VSGASRPVLNGRQADRALDVAREVGERLRDPHRLRQAIDAPLRESTLGYGAWQPIGLARGHPGLALAFAQLAGPFPAEGWEDEAHRQIVLAVEALRGKRSAPSGLTGGLAGLAFVMQTLGPSRYARVLSTLDGLIERRTRGALAALEAQASGCAREEIDVVSGLAGVGIHFLTRGEVDALRDILDSLIRLVRSDAQVPRWHTPAEFLRGPARLECPGGLLDCGLAHGLPGLLALFALSRTAGVVTAGLDEAIEVASSWLRAQAIEDVWGVNWPYFVPLGHAPGGEPAARAGWCYGAPGIARALWLAGAAADDIGLRALAVEALEAVHQRPPEERRIDAPTLCHGAAGLLQITLRLAADTGSERLYASAADVAVHVVDAFEADSLFGYRDLDPDGTPVDRAGVLEGAGGVALALLAAAGASASDWDRMLLLA